MALIPPRDVDKVAERERERETLSVSLKMMVGVYGRFKGPPYK